MRPLPERKRVVPPTRSVGTEAENLDSDWTTGYVRCMTWFRNKRCAWYLRTWGFSVCRENEGRVDFGPSMEVGRKIPYEISYQLITVYRFNTTCTTSCTSLVLGCTILAKCGRQT